MKSSNPLLACVAIVLAVPIRADLPSGDAVPTPLEPGLTADAIYQRALENRFRSAVQDLEIVSGDRAGREQPLRLLMLWKRYPEDTEEARNGVLSRTLVRYLEPADIRGTGYLVINKRDAPNDQFVYFSSMRRTRRINLRSEGVVGTDLSVEDIVPREMEEATYTRMPDERVGGEPCYVIEAIPVPDAHSQYTKLWIYVEGTHFVPLRTRYWDQGGLEIKELSAEQDSIRELGGIWLPIRATMRHLIQETYTELHVARLAPDPDLPKKFFTQRQLESRRMRLPKNLLEEVIDTDQGTTPMR